MPIIPNICDTYHGNSINFTEIKAAGIVGTIFKARQGLGYSDPAYAKRRAAAKAMGFLVGAYDFATGDAAYVNALDFLSYAKLAPDDAAILDFENNTVSEMTAVQAYTFLDTINQRRGTASWIYGGDRIREQIDPQDSRWIDMAKVTPLWQCRYIGTQPADNAALFAAIPPIPPWTENFVIQYCGDGVGPMPHTIQGLQNGADLDVFNGTRDELAKVWAGASLSATGVA